MSISPRWTGCCVTLVGVALTYCGVRPVDAQPSASSQPAGAAFVDLNRAIKAYLDQDRAAAAALFEQLLKSDPQAEYRPTCLYYLGLIALDEGLGHSNAAQLAKAEDPEARVRESDAAREQYTKAQGYFEQIVVLADPTAEMVQAALLLGIAQLVRDNAEGTPEAVALAERAEQTLQRYVTETEQGAVDRYGQFYLLVARYRLADMYRAPQLGRGALSLEKLHRAADNLKQALALAAADRDLGKMPAGDYDYFQDVTTYYDALLALLREDNATARQRLGVVKERQAGASLGQNAADIIDTLDKVEANNPRPISLPVPAPIGPWDFEGRLRIGNWYDSNVILLGKNTTLPLGYKRKDDYRLDLMADFNISRFISKAEAPWLPGESLTVGFGGGTSNSWQPNIAQFDVNRYPARVYLNWQPIPDLYVGVQYEYSYTQLGHKPFISSQRITPVISKEWRVPTGDGSEPRNLGHTDLYYTQDARNYLERLPDFRLNRDGTYRALGIQHTVNIARAKDLFYMQDYYATKAHQPEQVYLGQDWLKFYFGYEFREERTVGTEFDLGGNSLVYGLHVPLPYRFAFELDGEFTWSDYSHASIFDYDRKERSDFLQRYKFAVIYSFVTRGELPQMRSLDVKLRTGVEMTFQNSNIWNRLGENIYEYDRAVYGAQLEIGF